LRPRPRPRRKRIDRAQPCACASLWHDRMTRRMTSEMTRMVSSMSRQLCVTGYCVAWLCPEHFWCKSQHDALLTRRRDVIQTPARRRRAGQQPPNASSPLARPLLLWTPSVRSIGTRGLRLLAWPLGERTLRATLGHSRNPCRMHSLCAGASDRLACHPRPFGATRAQPSFSATYFRIDASAASVN
jgi:hypothetical protein